MIETRTRSLFRLRLIRSRIWQSSQKAFAPPSPTCADCTEAKSLSVNRPVEAGEVIWVLG
jgi:hypothetical protein